MKLKNTRLINLLILIFLFSSCQEQKKSKQKMTTQSTMNKIEKKEKLLRHVVLFKFKEESSDEAIEELNQSFQALATAIPEIKDFEWGLNDSPEDFHQGFTHCYLVTFVSEKDRDSVYTPHPEHQAFVKSLQPHLEKVFVVDYWTEL